MKTSRRVVTRINSDGQSEVLIDSEPSVIYRPDGTSEIEIQEIWITANPANVPSQTCDPTRENPEFLPAAGETRFRVVTIEPTKSFDLSTALHRADLVEYLVVLSGRIHLVLPSGDPVELSVGDYVVQEGTEHAWNNPYSKPCTIAVILIGARSILQRTTTS